jgi:hypothetical protein
MVSKITVRIWVTNVNNCPVRERTATNMFKALYIRENWSIKSLYESTFRIPLPNSTKRIHF